MIKPQNTDLNSKKTLAVIGNKGRMGQMLCSFWEKAGFTVRGCDLPETPCPSLFAGAEFIVLCVPASTLPSVLEAVVPHLRPPQVLLDITSVKILPMQEMQSRYEGPVVGTHPLFGPAPNPEDRLVALVPGAQASPEITQQVEALFTAFGCRCFTTTAQEHDHAVAFVQGLNFISSAAYFATLAGRKEILPFLTPSFRKRLADSRKLLTEDAAMFQTFTKANPLTQNALHSFQLFLELTGSGGLEQVVARAQSWYTEPID